MTRQPPAYSQFLAPRYWLTWLGIGLLCLIALLPLTLRLWFGARLGDLTYALARERRYITRINIGRCFTELSAAQQHSLVRDTFRENGIGLVETACGWIRSPAHFKHLSILKGGDALAAALAQGRGVLLLGAHYTTLDFSANLLSQYFPFAVTYRAHKNPLFDAFMLRGRLRNCNGVFDRFDIRGAFRHLRAGKILWYAPDQDYGPEQAVFAPFFGHTAATITAGMRFAAANKSPVFVVRHHRGSGPQPYTLEAIPFPNYPSGDDVADATRLNQAFEACIRINPAQYLWMHKRFKTQPGGKPQSPYIFIRTPQRKLSAGRYQTLLTAAQPLPAHEDRLALASGLQLRRFAGIGHWRHPALRLDQRAKLLRSRGIATVTVDSLFRVPHLHQTLALCFVPDGVALGPATAPGVSAATAAQFFLTLHAAGASLPLLQTQDLLITPTGLALDDPLRLRLRPGTASHQERLNDLRQLAQLLDYSQPQRDDFNTAYLRGLKPDLRHAMQGLLAAAEATADNAAAPSQEVPFT